MEKSYPNKHEDATARYLRVMGWEPTKQGWPDFIAFTETEDGEEAIVVEVKPRNWDYLSREQERVMHFLERHGVKCFVSDGDSLRDWRELATFDGGYGSNPRRVSGEAT